MANDKDFDVFSEQLVDLQTQLAFQEQTIAELNQALTRHHSDIEMLRREWRLLKEQHTSLQEQLPDSGGAEKPPHY